MGSQAYQCFEVSVENKIAHIKMNRPEVRNNMNRAFWDELPVLIRKIDHDADATARVIVIVINRAAFLRRSWMFPCFPAMTVSKMTARRPACGGVKRPARASCRIRSSCMQDSFNVLENCRVPVLVAIQGGCIGGGVDLVTACRYALCDARCLCHDL